MSILKKLSGVAIAVGAIGATVSFCAAGVAGIFFHSLTGVKIAVLCEAACVGLFYAGFPLFFKALKEVIAEKYPPPTVQH